MKASRAHLARIHPAFPTPPSVLATHIRPLCMSYAFTSHGDHRDALQSRRGVQARRNHDCHDPCRDNLGSCDDSDEDSNGHLQSYPFPSAPDGIFLISTIQHTQAGPRGRLPLHHSRDARHGDCNRTCYSGCSMSLLLVGVHVVSSQRNAWMGNSPSLRSC